MSAGRLAAFGAAALCMEIVISSPAGGQDSQDLAKQLANPIANLMSFPLQINEDENFGLAAEARSLPEADSARHLASDSFQRKPVQPF